MMANKKLFIQEKAIVWIWLFGGGLILRILVALLTNGQIHADEIFQAREIAHSWLFPELYVIVPWEFLTPEVNQSSAGASRSVIFPLFSYVVMYFSTILNFNYWNVTLIILRVFFACISALLIPAIYTFAKELVKGNKENVETRTILLSTFIVAYYYIFLYYGIRPLTNVFYTPFMFFALAIYLRVIYTPDVKSKLKLGLISGILLGFCFAIRPDSIAFYGAFFIIYHTKKLWGKYGFGAFIGFITLVIIQGWTDLLYYGSFLASPINWFIFNVVENKSGDFGEAPIYYFFAHIVLRSLFLVATVILVLISILTIRKRLVNKVHPSSRDKFFFITIIRLILWALTILILYSMPLHKELRFIYPILPVLVIIVAFIIDYCYRYLLPRVTALVTRITTNYDWKPLRKDITPLLLMGCVCLSVFALSAFDGIREDWDSNGDVFRAAEWVGQRSDSTGVIIFTNWYSSGGYSAIHKNIILCFYDNTTTSFGCIYLSDYKQILCFYIEFWAITKVNYLICPHYQYMLDSNATNVFEANGYFKITEIDRKCDIFFRESI